MINLKDAIRSKIHTHTAADTAESITIGVEGTNNYWNIWADSDFWIGSTKAEAEAHKMGAPADTIITVATQSLTAIWVDTATSGKVYLCPHYSMT